MTLELARPELSQRAASALRVVDTDVHHNVRSPKDLFPYLSKLHQERLEEHGLPSFGNVYLNNGGYRGRRVDTLQADGSDAGSKLHNIQGQLLDEYGIDVALLTSAPPLYDLNAVTDVDYAAALMRAFNDYTIEHWLAKEPRLRYAMFVSIHDTKLAIREIERIGDHPQIVSVMVSNGGHRTLGNRFYDPIWEACERHKLAVSHHFGTEGKGIFGAPSAAGFPSYYVESRFMRPSNYQVHLASYVFEGTFEKFPSLRVAMLEGGWAWVPSYVWRMDADWKSLRNQTPWVKRLPSQ